MSRRRIDLALGYILHHQPWRDTSRILEVLLREHGRLSLFARAVRGPAARLAPVLQPFRPLLISFSGAGEAANLSHAERADDCGALPAERLMAAFYLNELLLKLTTRHDPQPALFDHYHAALGELRSGAPLEPALRRFEKRLLELIGYGLELASEADGAPLAADGYYQFRPADGFTRTEAGVPGALAGASLLALREERFEEPRVLEDARRVLQAALGDCLEGRPLATRAVARSMVRKAARS
ncbi:MAG TPA: DNA repair protein RecO [Steroidobacteraceae bacterium]|jgi:DNA repair protein RecO (recombination protein O)|nr:DNA repair protein RecO [Steroidobacteraceae bacterium]